MSGWIKAAKIAALIVFLGVTAIGAFGWGLLLGDKLGSKGFGLALTLSLTVTFWLLVFKSGREFLKRNWKRIGVVLAGQGIYSTISWLYDNPLYMLVIGKFGPVDGGIGMLIASFIFCFLTLLWYEGKKVDWLGVREMDILRDAIVNFSKRLAKWRLLDFSQPVILLLTVAIWVSACHLLFSQLGNGGLSFETAKSDPILVLVFLVWAIWLAIYVVTRIFIFLMRLVERGGDVMAFFFFSIFEDSFVTVAYLRHGAFNGLRKRDFVILVASTIVSNVYWTVRTYVVVTLARIAGETFFPVAWDGFVAQLNHAFCLALGWLFGC